MDVEDRYDWRRTRVTDPSAEEFTASRRDREMEGGCGLMLFVSFGQEKNRTDGTSGVLMSGHIAYKIYVHK